MSEPATVDAAAMQAARERMRQRMGGAGNRKGGVRVNARPVTTVPKVEGNEKLKAALKKLGMQNLASVDEVVLQKSDNTYMVFNQPKLSIAPHSNCTQVTGTYEVREEATQMMDLLNKIKMMPNFAGLKAPGAAAGMEDDVPDLVEDFEAVATDGAKKIEEVD